MEEQTGKNIQDILKENNSKERVGIPSYLNVEIYSETISNAMQYSSKTDHK